MMTLPKIRKIEALTDAATLVLTGGLAAVMLVGLATASGAAGW